MQRLYRICPAAVVTCVLLLASAGCAEKVRLAPARSPAPPLSSALRTLAKSYPAVLEYDARSTGIEEIGVTQLTAMAQTTRPAVERVVIYNGEVQVAVVSIGNALAVAQEIAKDSGGYMQSLTSTEITIRIPAARFFQTIDRVAALGQLMDRKVNAEDVTDQYVDLQLRLRSAETLRDRYLALLERAKTVKETLEIERELNRVREEIERIKGKLAALQDRIAYSTLTIKFVQSSEPVVQKYRPATPFPWVDELTVESVLRVGDE